jgi:alpha-tubulin suppressor-like RCC1 family protein
MAVKMNGTLWAWGFGTSGQLGDNTLVSKSSPIQIGSGINWKQVATGQGHSIMLKTDGTIWVTGAGTSGQIGDGTAVSKSSPVQVGNLTTWSRVSSGINHCAALKADGTLWTWGANGNGQLGDGTNVNKSSPVQFGSQSNWSYVSCGGFNTFAINSSGELWATGDNSVSGPLGDNTIVTRSSPVQIGTSTTWKTVSGSYAGTHTIAINTDGTLWTWGNNSAGQLGDGTIAKKSSPVQIGSLTNWKSVTAQTNTSHALKTDGTLWGWGMNDNATGFICDGTAVNKSSPVQIGSLTSWSQVNDGQATLVGIT